MRWVAIGLDAPFTEYTGRFKNVAITDNEDLDKSSFIIWDRVYKATEERDIKRIKAILKAGELL